MPSPKITNYTDIHDISTSESSDFMAIYKNCIIIIIIHDVTTNVHIWSITFTSNHSPLHQHPQFQHLLRDGKVSCHHVYVSRYTRKILHSATHNKWTTNNYHNHTLSVYQNYTTWLTVTDQSINQLSFISNKQVHNVYK